jgi:threonylcarbamoyladenosine tRNA methylthiotransferase MtaB
MVGCRLNQSELERMGSQARQAGHHLVGEISQADMAIINTCAVTTKAAAESRKLTRKVKREGVPEIIITGCWASLEPDVAASLPGVTHVVTNLQKNELQQIVLKPIDLTIDIEPSQRQPLPGARKRTRAFIKVQDGCDKRCTYCVTTIARGRSKSEKLKNILDEIHAAVAGGTKEVILTGVQLGSWGLDFPEKRSLETLIRSILYHTDVPRIRLSSLEPWGISDSLLEVWQDPRVCQQIHLPLQSGSALTLRHMARNTNPDRFRVLANRIRQRYPQLAITTDIIVGFPGESESSFEESLAYIKSIQFADGHVFSFSKRPGTAASNLPEQISPRIRRERSQHMRSVLTKSAREFQSRFLGSSVSVLWQSLVELDASGWTLTGLSSEGLKIRTHGTPSDLNQINNVLISDHHEDGSLIGQIIEV